MYLNNKKGDFIDEMDLSEAEFLIGETSGVLKKAMKENMEKSEGLKEFEKEVSVDTGELDEDGNYVVD